MKGVNCYWSLFNKRKNVQIDGLTFSQLSLLVFTMSEEYMLEWFVWHEDADDWDHLISYQPNLDPTAHEYVFREHPVAPSVAPDGSTVDAPKEIKLKDSKRLTKRFQKTFKVFVRSPNKIVETNTIDISLMGMKVMDPMPEAFGKVEVTIISGQDKLDAIAEVIDDQGRNRLKLIRVSNLEKLSKWLIS